MIAQLPLFASMPQPSQRLYDLLGAPDPPGQYPILSYSFLSGEFFPDGVYLFLSQDALLSATGTTRWGESIIIQERRHASR